MIYSKWLLAAAFTLTAFSLTAQCPDALREYGVPFSTVKADQFSFLDDDLRDATLIGLGEDTHGTAEYANMVSELFFYLVRQHGVRILIVEDAFGPVRKMNEYIAGTRATPELYAGNWRYYTVGFKALLDRLKEHNVANPQDPVFIYGPEMQYAHDDATFVSDYLKSKGEHVDFSALTELSTIWKPLKRGQLMDQLIVLEKAAVLMEEMRLDWKAEPEYQLAAQHLNVVRQFLTTRLQTTGQRKHDFREIYMLENIQWVLRHHGAAAKALFWAHNGHVGTGRGNGTDMVGHHLRRAFGDRYFTIGTDVAKGRFRAYPSDANETGWRMRTFDFPAIEKGSFTGCLEGMGNPFAYLNFRAARRDERLREFLNQPQLMMSGAGARVRREGTERMRVGAIFDAIIYLDRSTPIKFLD